MATPPKPKFCGQNWLDMTPAERGRICGQCNKLIVDFSKMTWTEIDHMQRQNNYSICGMYHPRQLEHWGRNIPPKTWDVKRLIAISSLAVSLSSSVNAQTNTARTDSLIITGTVLDSNTKEPVIGASLFLRNSKNHCKTNIDGVFTMLVKDIPDGPFPDTLEAATIYYLPKQIAFDDLKSIARKEIDSETPQAHINIVLEEDPNAILSSFFIMKPTFKQRVKNTLRRWFSRKK